MPPLEVTESMVNKALSNINKSKSPGPDNLHPRVLHEVRNEISFPLWKIFSLSLLTNKVPSKWKEAIVTPIFKKGKRNLPSNYRPVSLTSIASKILESFIRDHILEHMRKNNLSKKQFGFINGRSTILQLMHVLDDWINAIDNSRITDAIYMDFQKAFDTVPHNRLLHKLEGYGMLPIIPWVKDFLTNRKHKVNVQGETSNWAQVTSGIPQGSVIGPVLFAVFINDLPDSVTNDIYMFADDTKIYSTIDNVTDSERLQHDLDLMSRWSKQWLLLFHPEKCKVMRIGHSKVLPQYEYKLDHTPLEYINEETDLGITIDDKLKFSNHIEGKVNKANKIMGLIRRSFKYLVPDIFTKLYKSLVRPHLEYGVALLNPHLKKDIRLLEGVQRRATKLVNNFENETYTERLTALHLPTLLYRRGRGDMIECYKLLNGKYDPEVSNILTLHQHAVGSNRTRGHSLKLYNDKCRLNCAKYYFSNRITRLWNDLPEEVIKAETTNQFKNLLDAYWSKFKILYDFDKSLNFFHPE